MHLLLYFPVVNIQEGCIFDYRSKVCVVHSQIKVSHISDTYRSNITELGCLFLDLSFLVHSLKRYFFLSQMYLHAPACFLSFDMVISYNVGWCRYKH